MGYNTRALLCTDENFRSLHFFDERIVLVSQSDFFKKLLTSDFKEAQQVHDSLFAFWCRYVSSHWISLFSFYHLSSIYPSITLHLYSLYLYLYLYLYLSLSKRPLSFSLETASLSLALSLSLSIHIYLLETVLSERRSLSCARNNLLLCMQDRIELNFPDPHHIFPDVLSFMYRGLVTNNSFSE